MSASQQPAFDEATQVRISRPPLPPGASSYGGRPHGLEHSDTSRSPSAERARPVLGAGAVKGKDAGIHSRANGQVLEHVSLPSGHRAAY